MATPTVTARLVPTPVARDLGDPAGTATPGSDADLAAVVAGVTGVDSVEVVGGSQDGGTTPGDGVVHLLVTVEGESSVEDAETIIDNVLALDTADVYDDGGSDLVLTYAPGAEDKVEADPTVADSGDVEADIDDEDIADQTFDIIFTPTATGGKIVSVAVADTDDLEDTGSATASIDIVSGDPQGHESQKNPDNAVKVRVSGIPADATVASYTITATFTDSNGRTGDGTAEVDVVDSGA